jgi:hypothetical protein
MSKAKRSTGIEVQFFHDAVCYSGSVKNLVAAGLVSTANIPADRGDRYAKEYKLQGAEACCYWNGGDEHPHITIQDPQPKICEPLVRFALAPTTPPTVRDYSWGCIYTGTKPQLIAAGLIPAKEWPTKKQARIGAERTYSLIPRNDSKGYCRARVSGDDYPTDTRPGNVHVRYEAQDMEPAIERAVQEMCALFAKQLEVVRGMKPAPLSGLLRAKARKAE